LGRQKQEEEKEEKQSKFQDEMEFQSNARERREANRKEFLEGSHKFGDMNMSGADLEKLMKFIKNPDIQQRISEKLSAKGVDKKSIAKGQAEMNEYIKLKEKEEKEGKDSLSTSEKLRMQQINESKEFKVYAETSVQVAREQGFVPSSENTQSAMTARTSDDKADKLDAKSNVVSQQADAKQETSNKFVDNKVVDLSSSISTKADNREPLSVASGREYIATSIELTNTYNAQAGKMTAANTQSSLLDMDVSVSASVAQNKVQPAAMVVASL